MYTEREPEMKEQTTEGLLACFHAFMRCESKAVYTCVRERQRVFV